MIGPGRAREPVHVPLLGLPAAACDLAVHGFTPYRRPTSLGNAGRYRAGALSPLLGKSELRAGSSWQEVPRGPGRTRIRPVSHSRVSMVRFNKSSRHDLSRR